jgi:hypothetical protein
VACATRQGGQFFPTSLLELAVEGPQFVESETADRFDDVKERHAAVPPRKGQRDVERLRGAIRQVGRYENPPEARA